MPAKKRRKNVRKRSATTMTMPSVEDRLKRIEEALGALALAVNCDKTHGAAKLRFEPLLQLRELAARHRDFATDPGERETLHAIFQSICHVLAYALDAQRKLTYVYLATYQFAADGHVAPGHPLAQIKALQELEANPSFDRNTYGGPDYDAWDGASRVEWAILSMFDQAHSGSPPAASPTWTGSKGPDNQRIRDLLAQILGRNSDYESLLIELAAR
ncbi:MAG: hypothetical protein NW201_14275 [Gemmatimonadales bacterium]|nr:hypothetical protein [Gemmatimonadales bacterium]